MTHHRHIKTVLLVGIMLVGAALACNAGGASTEATPTATVTPTGGDVTEEAAEATTEATEESGGEPTEEATEEATTESSGDTTGGDSECAAVSATFISDVSVPDGTEFDPGETFTKTWRLNNNGCEAWPSGTKLVYVSGNQMGGPNAVTVSSNVPAGINADVSVNLTAPSIAGTYRGDWRLETPDGTRFGPQIYLEIVVVAPATEEPTEEPTEEATEEPETHTVTLSPLAYSKSGNVSSGGCSATLRAGIAPAGNGIRGYVAYDVSDIVGATDIIAATMDMSSYTLTGSPFEFLHPLIVEQMLGISNACDYPDSYEDPNERKLFEVSDTPGLTSNVVITNKFASAMEDDISTFIVRIRWDSDDAGSAFASMIQWSTIKLTVTYEK